MACQEVSKEPRACDAQCTVRRAVQLTGSCFSQEPALQELTDLNSPEFSPYLFSRQELTLAVPLHATDITIPN